MTTSPTTLRLLFWPCLITMAISALRITGEVQGWVAPRSGGALHPLGIVWCVFVFGAWFGRRLAAAGHGPRVARPRLWASLAMVGMIAGVMATFGPVREAQDNPAGHDMLRSAVLSAGGVAAAMAIASCFVWPQLARTLLVYGLVERGTVVALTWLAKDSGWVTHYTKFGPGGFEYDMSRTMVSACIAQLGVWVPFTIVAGGCAGAWFAPRRSGSARAAPA